MTDEKLIEEAANAVLDAWQVRTMRPVDERLSLAETAVRAARAVFEKVHAVTERHSMSVTDSEAHTPTDDAAEREEIARIIGGHIDVPVSSRLAIARSLQGNGFRRSEVPEPSAEVVELRKQIEKLDADLGQQIDRTEELHDIADRLSWAIAPMSEIGEHSSANDPWENAIEYAASRQWAEPQGEPSDAQEAVDRLSNRVVTTAMIRAGYVGEPEHWMDDLVGEEFDRWLAAHDAEVRAGFGTEEPEWSVERAVLWDDEKRSPGEFERKVTRWVPVKQGGAEP